jgi:Tfp pilus assembly protein PilF
LGLALAHCAGAKPKPNVQAQSSAATPEVPDQPRTDAEAKARRTDGLPPPEPQKPVGLSSANQEAFSRALNRARNGDNAGAEAELLKLTNKKNTGLAFAWVDLGVLYERDGQPARAEDAYQKALAAEPDLPLAWDFLARLDCRQKRPNAVEGMARARVQTSPSALGVRNALAYGLLCQNRLEDAATEAKKVLKADERNVRAMQLLAQVYYREHKFELARMVLENTKATDPNDPATLNALGMVNLVLKNRPAAMESFQKASALKPDFAEALNNYGAMLNDSQDYDSAVRVLEAAVQSAPDLVAARVNLGNAYRGKQDFAKAKAEYEEALKLSPNLADVYFNLAVLHLDADVAGQDALARLNASIAYFHKYRDQGGTDERVDTYLKDANKGIDRENRRRERERKDELRRAAAAAKAQGASGAAPTPAKGTLPPAPAPAPAKGTPPLASPPTKGTPPPAPPPGKASAPPNGQSSAKVGGAP